MNFLNSLIVAFSLFATTLFGADYPVLSYGALCNGSDDTVAFASTVSAAYAGGGGRVVVPAGKSCKVNGRVILANNSAMEVPIELTSDGGPYGARLYCDSCNTLVTIGMAGYFTYNKSVTNLILDLGGTSMSYPSALFVNNALHPKVSGVKIANSNFTRGSTTGVYLYNSPNALGTCSFPGGGSSVCFGAHGQFDVVLNGHFNFGFRVQGSRPTDNDNNNHHMITGTIAMSRTCGGATCYGVFLESSDTISINADVEGAHYGYYLRGSGHKVIGGRTEGNTLGVYMDSVGVSGGPTRAYNTVIVGGSHSDGISPLCPDCYVFGSYNGTKSVTLRGGVREISSTDPAQLGLQSGCTATAGSTCSFVVTIPGQFPTVPGLNYMAVCSVKPISGSPVFLGVTAQTSVNFVVTLGSYSGMSTGKVDCVLSLPDQL